MGFAYRRQQWRPLSSRQSLHERTRSWFIWHLLDSSGRTTAGAVFAFQYSLELDGEASTLYCVHHVFRRRDLLCKSYTPLSPSSTKHNVYVHVSALRNKHGGSHVLGLVQTIKNTLKFHAVGRILEKVISYRTSRLSSYCTLQEYNQ